MNIPKDYQTLLADEIAIVRKKMEDEADIRKKAYYYSAVYSMVQRIFNLYPNSDQQLIFMHIVLTYSYSQMRTLIDKIAIGDRLITIPDGFFDKISLYLQQLENKIRNNEDTYTILEKFAVLSYILEGNGHYLFQKNWLEIPE